MNKDKIERYFLDLEDEEAVLRDIDDNWNTDMDLAIKYATIKHNCTNRQILQMLPLDKFIDYLVHHKFIPNVIDRSDFIENNLDSKWLDNELDNELV